jgi:hypothetical protein
VSGIKFLDPGYLNNKGRRLFPIYYFAFCLLAADSVFIGIHCLWLWLPAVSSDVWNIETDRGYAEVYQYIKFFWIFLNFISISFIQSKLSYLTWASLFFYLLLDDSLSLHERLGKQVSSSLNFEDLMYLRSRDFGELLISFSVFLIFLILFAVVTSRSAKQFRKDSRILIVMLFGLAICGIGFDMIHVMVGSLPGSIGRNLFDLMGILEDGGEMVFVSIICCYSLSKILIFERRATTPMPQPKAIKAETHS